MAEKSRFGKALDEVLRRRGMNQARLAADLDVSAAYVSSVATGRKRIQPDRIERMADALDLTAAERRRLHRAAATDAGFRLDLPDDF